MKFTRLRLSGFKSFVEPTELLIEPGLTGVVGPNGCGKSNLLEALRWVMGESSYKSMRASGMDDVIFSGTTQRPSRNMAEVVVTMTNEARSAPPAYNDNDTLEISRRIEREAGSAYRINGRDVRARDVQLLFADVSTGARSPALVRQGQIAEIINAKPQARRLILEEAAGITGLHTRRHEAELKLKAAEQNLTRLEDVTSQLETQVNSLKRQARQAAKYKQLSADIRKLEAASLYVAWKEASGQARLDAESLDAITRDLAERTRAASEALRARDELGEKLPALREEEATRGAALQRLNIERSNLDDEERRIETRIKELQGRLAQVNADLDREREMMGDTERVTQRLSDEETALGELQANEEGLRNEAAAVMQASVTALAAAQEAADAANARLSELTAERNALLRRIEDAAQQVGRAEREEAATAEKRAALMAQISGASDAQMLATAVEAATGAVTSAEADANHAEVALRVARQVEADARTAHDDARRKADALATEIRTLTKLLDAGTDGLWPALVNQVKVEPGYEAALGAALGDDIDASSDEGAPAHWRGLPPLGSETYLPAGAQPLSSFVQGPPALDRKLSHVGVVTRSVGAAMQSQLQPGQRLVSREGDLWRWDGFTSAADAPNAAAKRLAERNRLAQLETEFTIADALAQAARKSFEDCRQGVDHGVKAERERREAWRASNAALEVARQALARHERQAAERMAQTATLDEAARRIAQSLAEHRGRRDAADAALADLPAIEGLTDEAATLRAEANAARAAYTEARARHDGFERDAASRASRIAAIKGERAQWASRAAKSSEQIAQLSARAEETQAAAGALAGTPQALAEKRQALLGLLQDAEGAKRAASDALVEAENAVRAADQNLRETQEAASSARENHARGDARLEASRARHASCEQKISEALNCEPADIPTATGLKEDELQASDQIERKLQGLRDDRERLGGVNLRADEEAVQVAEQLASLVKERDDLIQAVNKLRGGISSLNREGRQRLLDAFGTVNEKFGELFTTLFGGGRAELQLIESDDPLEAGLEILAHPPGKKPTVLSLLSGGEQTLTALALIFAVFLTNPSPICVLDEVDAPLDDHNVERFCNLLDAMLERTETRFLIITHHELTMSRMHRLFGVTMMERGVSQLVSVDLGQASAMAEAG